jgi:ABC-2 type transport system ATP-binding protein
MAAEDSFAIDAIDVRKRYRRAPTGTGLNGFDLRVPAGTVCGLLGPNGAGKTTAVRILSTLLRFDSGRARVAGHDVAAEPRRVRANIGVVGQYTAVDEVISGRENLVMFGRLHHLSARAATRRADELLGEFGLTEAGRRPAGTYSGGMRRRLDLAASLIVAPSVLFVDEPTTGLDPGARREVWSAIETLAGAGTTVLLTTQYLDEADHLADQIVLLSGGRVIAEGTPAELKSRVGTDWIEITVATDADVTRTVEIAHVVTDAEIRTDPEDPTVRIPVVDHGRALVEIAAALKGAGVTPVNVEIRRPTLDEVFLQFTRPGKVPA